DFVDMAEFVWRSNHLGIPMGEGEHCQWTVDDYDIKQTASRIVVTLSAPRAPAPTVTIACRRLHIAEISNADIDAVFPEWNRSGGPLVRPSLEQLTVRSLKKQSLVQRKRSGRGAAVRDQGPLREGKR